MTAKFHFVVVGASAGGIEAISAILAELRPAECASIVIVVHMPSAKDSHLVPLFQSMCQRPVVEVEDKQTLHPGHVYVAPPDYHVLVEDEVSLALCSDELVNYSRPSIDVLFESTADVFASHALGIILTGANRDGAFGLREIIRAGGMGVVQDPAQTPYRAMPEAAIEACPEAEVMNLQGIIQLLNERI